MRALIDALEGDPGDAAALDHLARHFHALCGMGATYGFPQVSVLGDEGEGSMKRLGRQGRRPMDADLAIWRGLIERIGAELC
jgi:chemotaxis protein histidine kinase CheA